MDISEVGRILNISRQMIYIHIDKGNLNPVKKGGEWFFNGSEVYRFMNKRLIGKNHHRVVDNLPTSISNVRKYKAEHILSLIDMLRRFEMRYELQQRYMPIFEFEKMLTSVFFEYKEPESIFAGVLINDVLSYIDGRMESEAEEESRVWEIFYEALQFAFTEPNDEFDRRSTFEDMLVDAAIELTSRHPMPE